MKNKKFLYGMIIFVLVLAIGIGYAALSKNMEIRGRVSTVDESVLAGNLNLKFSSFAAVKEYNLVEVEAVGNLEDIFEEAEYSPITISATGFKSVGDYCVAAIGVENISLDLDVAITASLKSADADVNDYFEVAFCFPTGGTAFQEENYDTFEEVAAGALTTDLAHGNETIVLVAIKMVASPTEVIENAAFVVNLRAETTND